MSVERGWVSVYGVVLSAYCYIFLFLMSCVFLLGGALLTGIAFRPQEVCYVGRIGVSTEQEVERNYQTILQLLKFGSTLHPPLTLSSEDTAMFSISFSLS